MPLNETSERLQEKSLESKKARRNISDINKKRNIANKSSENKIKTDCYYYQKSDKISDEMMK